uniref:Uncharacterized protein n=1 Tax=Geobacter sp. (strain M21) TaxID=443144 RepID=C6E013_GEOSM
MDREQARHTADLREYGQGGEASSKILPTVLAH